MIVLDLKDVFVVLDQDYLGEDNRYQRLSFALFYRLHNLFFQLFEVLD